METLPDFPTLARRSPELVARSSASTTTCVSNENTDTCQKPTNIPTSLLIAVGAGVPIVCAIILLFCLHRRNKRRQKIEDANDSHNSLDFGMGNVAGSKKNKKKKSAIPEMTITDTEKSVRRARGMSMDINSGPYLLPAGLQSSRESIHSLSRSGQDVDDPYRPVTFVKDDDASARYPRIRSDNASSYTESSSGTDGMNANLLSHAQKPPKAFPQRGDSTSPTGSSASMLPLGQVAAHGTLAQSDGRNGGLAPAAPDSARDSYFDRNARDIRKSNNYLGSFIHSRDPSVDVSAASAPPEKARAPHEPAMPKVELPPVEPAVEHTQQSSNGLPVTSRPPRLQSMEATIHDPNTASMISESSHYSDNIKIMPPSPPRAPVSHQAAPQQSLNAPMPVVEEGQSNNLDVQRPGMDSRRLSILRPLPPDDPTENPEERANRIRSFYKEYFDESKPESKNQFNHGDYYEDYSQEYLNEGTIYDTQTGGFVVAQAPYAQPVTRRAMTPPPRAPPRFQGGARGRASSGSTGHHLPPRGESSMSGRHYAPRKPLPPPAPLQTLPTPHMLKEDSMLYNPIDFAPPITYRDRQAGRAPDSPLGESRPYSPTVRVHSPLASSFDDLSVMPSPHALRKSGTFTALDFAAPPRFKGIDTGSDAASVRSNRSGMSNVQLQSLRAGAYRVSRIPKEVVGTKDDLLTSLKPTWDVRGAA